MAPPKWGLARMDALVAASTFLQNVCYTEKDPFENFFRIILPFAYVAIRAVTSEQKWRPAWVSFRTSPATSAQPRI